MYILHKTYMSITTQQAMQIAAEAMADRRTVEKIYEGKHSQRLVRERIEIAAKRLKLPLPPKERK